VARKRGQAVLVDQISERYQKRVKDGEMQQRELQVMARQIEQAKEAEDKAIKEKQARAK